MKDSANHSATIYPGYIFGTKRTFLLYSKYA